MAFCLGVLCLFYWALYATRSEEPSNAPAGAPVLDAAESERLARESDELARAGRTDEAIDDLHKLRAVYPQNHIYIRRLAMLYGKIGRRREEAELWEEFMKVAPTPEEACPALGEAYRKQDLIDRALDAHQRCLEINPKNSDAYFFLGHVHELERHADRARELYERGLSFNPTHADLELGVARLDLRAGKPAAAEARARAVLEHHHDYVDALLVLGLALWQERRPVAARAALERGVAKSERYVDFHLALGEIAEAEGLRDEALRRYRRALELDPESARVRRAVDRLGRTAR